MSKFLKPGAFRAVDVDSVDIMNEENQLPGQYEGTKDSYLNTLLAGLKLSLVINCAFCDACRFTA